jgi:hypothetical protein
MDRPVPTRCPLCEGAVHVERVRCDGCGTALEGRFSLDWPAQLSKEQLAFARVFLSCRGKIKDVEQALGVSYPTVVSRLDELVGALGGGAPAPRPAGTRLEVLEELAQGSIDIAEAERRLKTRR